MLCLLVSYILLTGELFVVNVILDLDYKVTTLNTHWSKEFYYLIFGLDWAPGLALWYHNNSVLI